MQLAHYFPTVNETRYKRPPQTTAAKPSIFTTNKKTDLSDKDQFKPASPIKQQPRFGALNPSIWQQLKQAAIQEDANLIHELEQQNIDRPDAFLAAAENGHVNVLKFLLFSATRLEPIIGETPLVQAKSDDSSTALSLAAANDQADAVRFLLANGAAIDAQDDTGRTALGWVAENGYEDIAAILLNNRAQVDLADDNGITPLMSAAENNHANTVATLLNHGAQVTLQDSDNQQTALLLATIFNYENIARLLLGQGARQNLNEIQVNLADSQEHTPLMHAARSNENLVRLLIEQGADVNARDRIQQTALFRAVKENQGDIAKLLSQSGAQINHQDISGSTALDYARTDEMIKILIERGARVFKDVTKPRLSSALKNACINNDKKLITRLILLGIPYPLTDQSQIQTPECQRYITLRQELTRYIASRKQSEAANMAQKRKHEPTEADTSSNKRSRSDSPR